MGSGLYTRNFLLISLANFFNVSGIGFFYLFPLFLTLHGATKSDIGIAMGISSLSSILFRPWISEMVDRIGRKRSYEIGCLIMTVVPLLYMRFEGKLEDFYLPLLLLRFIHGIGIAICFTAVFTYVADIVPKERLNEGLGMFGTTGLMGLAIGPSVAEFIVKSFGFPFFFLSSSMASFFSLIIIALLPESYSSPKKLSFLDILKTKKILPVSVISLLFGIALSATGNFVSPFSEEIGLGFISLYYISYSFSAITVRIFGGRIGDLFGEERVIPYGIIIESLGVFMLFFLKDELLLFLSGIISGCGHGILFPCLNSFIIKGQPAYIRGRLVGIFTGTIDLGIFLGSVLLGYVGEFFGFRTIFLLSSIILLTGLLIRLDT